jgi:hypothetical protein
MNLVQAEPMLGSTAQSAAERERNSFQSVAWEKMATQCLLLELR